MNAVAHAAAVPAGGADAQRAVQTVVVDGANRRWFGSGYLVSQALVLTAAHVLHGAKSAQVRLVDAPGRVRDVPGDVVFAEAEADVAVLQLRAAEPAVAPVVFGYLAGPVACEAVGFPRFKLNDDHRASESEGKTSGPGERWWYRDSHHIMGSCSPGSNRYSGTLELTVSPPGHDPDPDVSPWEGMSGSAVFADGLLIGMVAEHHRREGLGRLTARTALSWNQVLDPQLFARLQKLLAVPSQGLLAAAGAVSVSGVMRALPRDTTGFTGRGRELEPLIALQAEADEGVLAVYVVDGMPGVGKSAFAIHAAHLLVGQFPDGQMFLRLHGHTPGRAPLSAAAALDALLTADGLSPAELPETVEDKQALWRTRTATRRMLLVLDDAANATQVAPLLPAAPQTLVLVTSRRKLIGLEGAFPISLDVLPPAQAAALLVRIAARPGLDPVDQDVQELVRLCGYLPLAVNLVGAMLAHHGAWTPADVVGDFRQAGDRLSVLVGADGGVAVALDLSYRDLDAGQQRLYRLLGAHPGTEYDTPAAAALLGTDPAAARPLLAGLADHRLLEETATRGRYRMHALTVEHAAGLAAADPEASRAVTALIGHFLAVAGADPVGRAPADPADREQALVWARTERDNLIACIRHAERGEDWQTVIALTAAIARVLEVDGPFLEAVALHSRATALAEHTDPAALATALNNLGQARWTTEEFAAAERDHIGALKLYKQLGDRRGQAHALDNLGQVRCVNDEYAAAERDHIGALELYKQLGDRRGQAHALDDLGRVRYMTSEFAAAERDHIRALKLYEQLGDRLGQANALNNLGRVRYMTSEYAAAERDLICALELYEQLGYRRGRADALDDLGRVRYMTSKYAAAERDHIRALELYEQLGYRLGQANALDSLGQVRYMTSEYAAAERDHIRALELYEQLDNRRGQADALDNLGQVRQALGDQAGAACFFERAGRMRRE